MFVKDYLIFLKEILRSEKDNVKRLLKIVILGSFLMFFVSLASSLIKLKIETTYQGRYVLLPYLKNQQEYDHTLSLALIDQSIINNIESKFENTTFLDNVELNETYVQNITQHQAAALNYEINYFDENTYIGEHILAMYQWNLDDFYTIDSTVVSFSDIIDTGADLILPKTFDHNLNQVDNQLITVQTSSDIEAIVKEINQNLLSPLYEYRLEDFSMDELLIAIVGSIEKILLLFSFLIFSVSSSNIGTVMPYFVNEFKDEINLLCLMGMSKHIIFYIFMLASVFILWIALHVSFFISYIIYILFALTLKITIKLPFIKVFFIFIFQLICGSFFSYQSIKKATIEATYL